MSELKIGDRVVVYEAKPNLTVRKVGVIINIGEVNTDLLIVDTGPDLGGTFFAHRKQVRKLVKKSRLEFWLRVCSDARNHMETCPILPGVSIHKKCDDCEIVKVREVK